MLDALNEAAFDALRAGRGIGAVLPFGIKALIASAGRRLAPARWMKSPAR